MKRVFIIILFSLFLVSLPATALISEWNTLEVDNFMVFYTDGYYHVAEETLYYLEKYLDCQHFLRQFFLEH